MKYLCLLLIVGASFAACKKNNNTTAAKPSKLPSAFTGLKTWRYSHYRRVSQGGYNWDTTTTGVDNFSISTIGTDTVVMGTDKLYYRSTDTETSGYTYNYQGYIGWSSTHARFVHDTAGDKIYYTIPYQQFAASDIKEYVTP